MSRIPPGVLQEAVRRPLGCVGDSLLRYAIISDLHANLPALTAVLDEIDRVGVDRIVCLGDVVGYNANPNECVKIIRERQIPTLCGNHDAVACGTADPWGFNPIALAAALWTRQNLEPSHLAWLRGLPDSQRFPDFLAVHGSPTNRDIYLFGWEDAMPQMNFLRSQSISLCFFGHTHCPGIFSMDGVYTIKNGAGLVLGEDDVFLVNPGSVGQPRDGDPRAAYGIFDTETREFQLARVAYPVEQAAGRIIEAGLPQFLAERLSLGR